ncbi:hypothetical protein BLAHAN_04103 [Blautia hansenii DSM 20583]|uniref:Uncharacterized protein n=1 Tax=Blautia hansenii DSM 20583 TaxID=537007 RepID=C9L3Z1_BLAHA|nr:hypothetical protein BLAHAN_04103 [Blautia hansenii DSM 20583]
MHYVYVLYLKAGIAKYKNALYNNNMGNHKAGRLTLYFLEGLPSNQKKGGLANGYIF